MGTLNSVLLYIQCQTIDTHMQIKQTNKKRCENAQECQKATSNANALETNSNNTHFPTKLRGFPIHSN